MPIEKLNEEETTNKLESIFHQALDQSKDIEEGKLVEIIGKYLSELPPDIRQKVLDSEFLEAGK